MRSIPSYFLCLSFIFPFSLPSPLLYLSCSLDVDPLKIPDPETHWNEFLNEIKKANDIAPQVWNPITKKLEKWIDIKNLDRSYNLDKGALHTLI